MKCLPAMTNHADATQDESAHDDLADVWLGTQHFAKVGSLDADQAAIRSGAARNESLPIVEQVELTSELALSVHPEDLWLAIIIDIEDLNAAVKHEKKINRALAALEKHWPLRVIVHTRIRDALGRRQGWERETFALRAVRSAVDFGRDQFARQWARSSLTFIAYARTASAALVG